MHWDEDPAEEVLQCRVELLEALTAEQRRRIGDQVMTEHHAQWEIFQRSLRNALERTVESVHITALFGVSRVFDSIGSACDYLASGGAEATAPLSAAQTFLGYEIIVKYSNGDRTDMQFRDPQTALTSLRRLL